MSRVVKFTITEINGSAVTPASKTFDILYISKLEYSSSTASLLYYFDSDGEVEILYKVVGDIDASLVKLLAGFFKVTVIDYVEENNDTETLLNARQVKDIKTVNDDYVQIHYFKDYTLYEQTALKVTE